MNARYSWQSLDDVRLWIARTVIALTVSGALVGVFAEIAGLALLASLCGAPLYAVWAYHNWKDYTKKKGGLSSKSLGNDPQAVSIKNEMNNARRAFWLHLLWAVGMVFLMLASLNALVGIGVSTAFILSIPVLGPIVPVLYTLGWFGEVYNAMWKNVDENDDKGQVLRLTTLARVQMLTATSCLAIPLGAMALTGGLGAATLIMPLAIPFALSSVYTLCKLIRIKFDGKYKPDPLMRMIEKVLPRSIREDKGRPTTLRNWIFGFLLAAGCALGYGLGYGAGFVLGVGVSVTAAPILLGVAASLTLASFSFKEFFVDSRSKNNRLFGAVIPLLGSIGLFVGTVLLPTVPIISVLGVMLFAGGAAVRWFNRSRNNAYMRDLEKLGKSSKSDRVNNLNVHDVGKKIELAKKKGLGGIDLWAKLADYACRATRATRATRVADDSTAASAKKPEELAHEANVVIDHLIKEVKRPYSLSAKDIDHLSVACRDLAEVAAKKPDVEKETLHTLISKTITKITESESDVPMSAFANLVAAVKSSGFTGDAEVSIGFLSTACRDLAKVVAKKPDVEKETLHMLISDTITKIIKSESDVPMSAFANLVAAVKNSGFTNTGQINSLCKKLCDNLHNTSSSVIDSDHPSPAFDDIAGVISHLQGGLLSGLDSSVIFRPEMIDSLSDSVFKDFVDNLNKSNFKITNMSDPQYNALWKRMSGHPDFTASPYVIFLLSNLRERASDLSADAIEWFYHVFFQGPDFSIFSCQDTFLLIEVISSFLKNKDCPDNVAEGFISDLSRITQRDLDSQGMVALSTLYLDLASSAPILKEKRSELNELISDTITKITEKGTADVPMSAFANLVAAMKKSEFDGPDKINDLCEQLCDKVKDGSIEAADMNNLSAACRDLRALISAASTKFSKCGHSLALDDPQALVASMGESQFRGKLEAEVGQLIRPEDELDADSDSKSPSTPSVVKALLENSALFSSSPDTETVQQPGAEIEFYVRLVTLLGNSKSSVGVSSPMLESVVRAILDRGSRKAADTKEADREKVTPSPPSPGVSGDGGG